MLKEIKVNTKALESMLFIWASIKDREKISEAFLEDLAGTPEMKGAMQENFNERSVQKVLSAISNRERLNSPTKEESRFWNYNMWMLEDPDMTQLMLNPVKVLNVNEVKKKAPADFPFESVEVIFFPGHFESVKQIENQLFINFFLVKADMFEENKVTIEDKDLKDYVMEQILTMK